ncbi:MAG: RibD family protein [Micavibrio sp.]|nr:RibD family protein [Micavibrio sp.]
MKPYVICHMLSSLDGKIDGSALRGLTETGEYETTGGLLDGDAWICGRVTMQQHFAQEAPFVPAAHSPAGPQVAFVARKDLPFAIAVDTQGKLNWKDADVYGDHLVCIVSEMASLEYLAMLRGKGISYIVAGSAEVDLKKALDVLGAEFGIRRLLLEGGGHINGAFLAAALVDEISLLLTPGIDGRKAVPALFDGMDSSRTAATALKLKSVEQRAKDTLWLRYEIIRT